MIEGPRMVEPVLLGRTPAALRVRPPVLGKDDDPGPHVHASRSGTVVLHSSGTGRLLAASGQSPVDQPQRRTGARLVVSAMITNAGGAHQPGPPRADSRPARRARTTSSAYPGLCRS